MKSIQELQAKQAKELAELEAAHKIAAELPVKPSSVQAWATTGEPWVNFKVQGIRGAIELIRQFLIVPFAEYRNGTLSLKPLEQLPPEFAANNSAGYAFDLNVSESVGSFGPRAKLSFFARLPVAGLVRVNLDIEGPNYIGTFYALKPDYQTWQGRLKKSSPVRPNPELNGASDKVIKWAGGSADHIVYSYLFVADQVDIDQPGSELTHAVDQLQNLSDAHDAKGGL